jgi:hypothetical protein
MPSQSSALRTCVKYYGIRGTIYHLGLKTSKALRMPERVQHWLWQMMEARYDKRFQVNTTQWFGLNVFLFYEPSSAVGLHRKLELLELPYSGYHFIDLGSGRGRALLIASEFPFKAIHGVELSEDAHQHAERNVKSYQSPTQQCRDLRVACQDARTYGLPPEPSVIYIFNSFPKEILVDVVAGIERSLKENPRELIVIYCNPRHREVLDAAPFLKPRPESEPFWAIYEHNPAATT